MIARRGMVSEIVLDNGTNFVGANNFLQELAKNQAKLRDKAEEKFQLKWTFVSPIARSVNECALAKICHQPIARAYRNMYQ